MKYGFGYTEEMILPRAGRMTLQQIINAYSFTHAWSSENLTIAGTTTTALDYKGVHNLANPDILSQPTYNLSSINFGGKPSLSFNGTTNYLIKNTLNFNNVNSGFQIDVFKSTTPRVLTTSDNASNGRLIRGYMNTSRIGFELLFVTNRFVSNNLTWDDTKGNAVAYCSTGTSYFISMNGNSSSGANLTIITGLDNGEWFNDIALRDNVAMGATISLTPTFFNIEWVFSGVGSNTLQSEVNALTLALKNYYSLN
jgi:hypothetical protein